MSDTPPNQNGDMIQRAEEILKDLFDRNSDFNEALDQTGSVEIPGRSLRLSEVLFWVDRTAYDEEKQIWSDQEVESLHENALEVLRTNDQVGLFSELVEAIERKRIAPFIGAGMSCSSGFPSWEQSLRQIHQRLGTAADANIATALESGDYMTAAELLWAADEAQVANYIRSKFAASNLRQRDISGAVLLLEKISSGCIVTTNFDRVIEAVISPLDGYMHGRQPGHNFVANLLRGKRCLLKLHGDTDSRESYVFTREQYDEAYGSPLDFTRPLSRALRQIYISHSLLFLGCGMTHDRTLDLFEHVHALGEFDIPDHFAILPDPSTEAPETRLQKESRLLEINVRPIWYPDGEHEYVERLLRLAIDCAEGRFSL